MTDFTGTSGNDDIDGTFASDDFFMQQGGNDRVNGGGAGDVFWFGAALNADDRINGGDGADTLVIEGAYVGTQVMQANTFRNVENITFLGAFDYNFMFDDANVAAGQLMTVTVGLPTGHRAILDFSDETDGGYLVFGSDGADQIFGGQDDDIIHAGLNFDEVTLGAGHDTVYGGDGGDTISVGTRLESQDHIEGGAGRDTVRIEGDYAGAIVLDGELVTGIEVLFFGAGHDYTVRLADDLVIDDDEFLTIASANLLVDDALDISAKGVTTYGLHVAGGQGNDRIVGSNVFDMIDGRGGGDFMQGGGGADHYIWNDVSESTGNAFDTIKGFDADTDRFLPLFVHSNGVVDGVNETVTQGKLNADNVNKGIKKAIGVEQLTADFAVVFQPDAGSLAGEYFLIVDGNGVAGYQTGADLVVYLASLKHAANLDIDNFGG
jgi:hypothetical protein